MTPQVRQASRHGDADTGDADTSGGGDGGDSSGGGDGGTTDGGSSGDDSGGSTTEPLCAGNTLSTEGVEEMLTLTTLNGRETIYTTTTESTVSPGCSRTARIRGECSPPRIDTSPIASSRPSSLAKSKTNAGASRSCSTLRAATFSTSRQPSPAAALVRWALLLPGRPARRLRTRTVLVAMVAHLTLDLPYALWAIDTTDEHADDYFVLGKLITPLFIDE